MNQKSITNYFNAQKPTDRIEKTVDHVNKKSRRMTIIPDFFKPLERKENKDQADDIENETSLPKETESGTVELPGSDAVEDSLDDGNDGTREQVSTGEGVKVDSEEVVQEIQKPVEIPPSAEAVAQSKDETPNQVKKRSFADMELGSAPQLIDATPKIFQTVKGKEPAFRRFASLVNSKTVALPKLYTDLLKRFDSLETIMNYMQSRGQTCVFHKIKRSVEMQSELSFELKHLGQIMYIYPSAYKLSPITIKMNEEKVNSLSIEFAQDLLSEQFVSKLSKESQPLTSGARLSNAVNAVNSNSLMSAVQEFTQQYKSRHVEVQTRLISRISSLHKEFLKENNLQWEYNPLKPTFHPLFKIEKVPDIPSAELPLKKQIPYLDQLKIKHGILEGKKPEQVELKKDTEEILTITDEKKPVSRAKALLERVRARQQQKANQPDQKENIEYEKRKSMLTRLPMIASSLQLHVKGLKKSIIPVPAAINHLIRSFSDVFLKPGMFALTIDEWYDHIKLLAEIVPSFCTLEIQIGAKSTGYESYLVRFHEGRMKQVREMVEEMKKK